MQWKKWPIGIAAALAAAVFAAACGKSSGDVRQAAGTGSFAMARQQPPAATASAAPASSPAAGSGVREEAPQSTGALPVAGGPASPPPALAAPPASSPAVSPAAPALPSAPSVQPAAQPGAAAAAPPADAASAQAAASLAGASAAPPDSGSGAVAADAEPSAAANKTPPAEGTDNEIHWSEFFDDEKQNAPSQKFWDMSGKTVTIKGYMGEVLSFEKHWFLIIPAPGAECPFDNGDETYWNKIMIAFTDKDTKLRYTSGALKITGRLDVGIKIDESGYKTMFRLYDAKFEKLKE